MADAFVCVQSYAHWEALPVQAQTLSGSGVFCSPSWYRSVLQTAMAPGQQARFDIATRGDDVLGVFPMQKHASGLSALTTPYTVLWSPLLRPDLDRGDLVDIGRALGRVWRRGALTRLDALDADAAWLPPVLEGLRWSGLLPLRFNHFGNWYLTVADLSWDGYLQFRPGALRSAIARRSRRLMGVEAATVTIVNGMDGLEAGLAAYDRVYAESWKEPEPYPDFNPALMRASASDGSLRLGILWLRGSPIAAQFWLVRDGWAGVQKLAHDERHKQFAPGTVLTAEMIRRLIELDHVSELDFGRGDDPYKQSWTGQRRQRIGFVLAATWHPTAAAYAIRHGAGKLAAATRRIRSRQTAARKPSEQPDSESGDGHRR